MAHNPEVAGSNPAPATMKTRLIDGFFVYLCWAHNPIAFESCVSDIFLLASITSRLVIIGMS